MPIGAVDAVLAEVRTPIERVGPEKAAFIHREGGLLVDIRPPEQRSTEEEIPGSLVIDRNVLEWRLDPIGFHRHPEAGSPKRTVVVFCQEGYASSFATAATCLAAVRAAFGRVDRHWHPMRTAKGSEGSGRGQLALTVSRC